MSSLPVSLVSPDPIPPGQPLPHLISRIEDRDLWNWAYPDTRPFLAALDALDFDFEQWARFHEAAEDPVQRAQIVARGQAVVDRFAQQVQTLAEGAFPLDFMGHRVWAVNAPSEFTSDLGNVLAETTDELVVRTVTASGTVMTPQIMDAPTLRVFSSGETWL